MQIYPYYIIQKRTGRLADFVPMKYRRTVIERMFKNGRVGGVILHEERASDPREAQRLGFLAKRAGAEVDVYVIERPNSPRVQVHNWWGQLWSMGRERKTLRELVNSNNSSS